MYVLSFSPGRRLNGSVIDSTIAELKTQKEPNCSSLNMDDKENLSNNSSTTSGMLQFSFLWNCCLYNMLTTYENHI
jgi:hypothetical protein